MSTKITNAVRSLSINIKMYNSWKPVRRLLLCTLSSVHNPKERKSSPQSSTRSRKKMISYMLFAMVIFYLMSVRPRCPFNTYHVAVESTCIWSFSSPFSTVTKMWFFDISNREVRARLWVVFRLWPLIPQAASYGPETIRDSSSHSYLISLQARLPSQKGL